MTSKQGTYFLKIKYRILLIIIVQIVAFSAEASPDVPPNQPVLVRPGDNSIGISTSPTLEITVSDPDPSDKLDVEFYGRTKGAATEPDFTLILIPDPQNESEFYPDIFISMTNWIVSQQSSRNIVFVTTAGDMVNDPNSNAQYMNADAAMDILDPAAIPYSVGAGNHDEPPTIFNDYFGISRFSGKSWYGGHYGTTNENSYSFFSASGMDFILINLDYNPTTAVLDWADALLKANSGHRAIVESHSILNYDNTWSNQSVFTALKDNPNLFLMLCGHTWTANDGAAYRSEIGDDGHTIHVMHADYQGFPNGGNGYMRILRFSPSNDKIYATTYSPYSGTSLTASPNQMEMGYSMPDGPGGPYTLIGTVSQADNGSNASIIWPDRLTNTAYEWYTTTSDGTTVVTGSTWSFTTASTPVCTPPSVPTAGAITQPTCALATGSVVLSGLPAGSWTINPGAITGNTSSITISGLNAGTYNYTVSSTPGCTSGTTSDIVINPQPVTPAQPGAVAGGTAVCQGVSRTYSIAAVAGATSYTWTLPSGWSGSSASTSITATVGSNGGNISVTANNSCGTSAPASFTVTVQTTPAQPVSIAGNTAVCQGVSQTYSIAAVAGATSYTWTLPSGWSGSSNSTSITATVSAASGNISVTANNTCGSGAARTLSVTATALPGQAGTITGETTVCLGSSQTYSISPVTGATAYAWTLPSGWSGSSTTTSITVNAGAASGNISVTANNSCGSGATRTISISVLAIPVQPGTIAGNTTVCQGVSQTYSIAAVAGATSYTWTLPSGWSGSSASTSITATVGSNGGNISVTANNSCGTSAPASLTVTVRTTPAQPVSIAGNTDVCQGVSQTYSIAAVAGATSYTWTLPSGWSGSSNSTSITATAGAASGNISVTANNTCGSGAARTLSVTATALPGQAGTITGETTVCLGSSQTYSISPVTGATAYAWTLPSGWSGSSTTTSITVNAGAASGNISVTANNSCGSGATRTISISVLAIPVQPGTIAGNTTVCQGVSQTYSIAAVAGATSYTWTLPSGWSGSSASISITVTPGATGGNISVTANNSCGSGAISMLDVDIGSIPSILTSRARGISASEAEGGGDLISDGGLAISEQGVCWSTSPDPTIADSRTSDGISLGSFTSTLAGLTSGVTYHIRAYATNCSGTGYGSDISYFHLPTAVIDIETGKILVFPNPVSELLNIEYADENIKSINIINSLGVLIGREKALTPGQQLDFSKFEYGTYILEFVYKNGDISRTKVIKAR